MNAGLHGWLGLLARLVTGGVWIVAGALKVTEPRTSIEAVRAYEILPGALVEPVGIALPAIELVVGIALVLGVFTRSAAAASAVLFAVFVAGIISVWMRGIEIDCGCFGGGGAETGATSDYPWEIARDVALLAVSAYVVALRRTRLALDRVLFPPTTEEEDVEEAEDAEPDRTGR